ncbi:MAG: sodium:alanine symporter family protein [Verrucomicrobia bacterium]|nr:sodium:alanine symporter family protein [Verrucomicrobiota bacterium]
MDFITKSIDYLLFLCCLFILAGSILLTVKSGFVQLRFFRSLFSMLKNLFIQRKGETSSHTILPHRALLTAMSTTLGISTIVGPVIAISLGGPGALFGFLLASFFGSAATYVEVSLCIQHRKKLDSGAIMGGPMQYLKHLVSPAMAKWYAICCLILMMAWSAAQANQVAAILSSPLLGNYKLSTALSGSVIAALVLLTMLGGIKRIGSLSAKLVPIMFFLYIGSSFWILVCNYDQLGKIFAEMFRSAFSPYPLASGAAVGGLMSALRWGIFKGTQATEAGVGTQTIPHSMAETNDPVTQGMLAMLSTFAAGFIAFLSGCVALVTKTWQDPSLPLGISMVAASFEHYFSYFGIAIVAISGLLFGFGTILGNCYNGSQCYSYLTENKKSRYYLLGTALMIFVGAVSEVKMIWSLVDLVMIFMVIPHLTALLMKGTKNRELVSQ